MSRYSVNDLFIKYVFVFYIHIKHTAGIRSDTEGKRLYIKYDCLLGEIIFMYK